MTDDRDSIFTRCIDLARETQCYHESLHPAIAALAARNDKILSLHGRAPADEEAVAWHGRFHLCEHAEFTLLERLMSGFDFCATRNHDCELYLTLEPCTARRPDKIPCVERIWRRGVRSVCIGMLDPNPQVWGKGLWKLKRAQKLHLLKHDIKIKYFPRRYREQLESLDLTKRFLERQQSDFRWSRIDTALKERRVFVDPDDPYLDVAYCLFRMYGMIETRTGLSAAKNREIILYNPTLDMFQDRDEFQVWWVEGLLKNLSKPRVRILCTEDAFNQKVLRSPHLSDIRSELKGKASRIQVRLLDRFEDTFWQGVLFANMEQRHIDYALRFIHPKEMFPPRRVVDVFDRTTADNPARAEVDRLLEHEALESADGWSALDAVLRTKTQPTDPQSTSGDTTEDSGHVKRT